MIKLKQWHFSINLEDNLQTKQMPCSTFPPLPRILLFQNNQQYWSKNWLLLKLLTMHNDSSCHEYQCFSWNKDTFDQLWWFLQSMQMPSSSFLHLRWTVVVPYCSKANCNIDQLIEYFFDQVTLPQIINVSIETKTLFNQSWGFSQSMQIPSSSFLHLRLPFQSKPPYWSIDWLLLQCGSRKYWVTLPWIINVSIQTKTETIKCEDFCNLCECSPISLTFACHSKANHNIDQLIDYFLIQIKKDWVTLPQIVRLSNAMMETIGCCY